jgi:hypothetical protein
MTMNDEDRQAIADSVTFSELDDESIGIKALIANLGWDEDPAPGRNEMTGAWRLNFRDSLPDTDWRIDRPRSAKAKAQGEARRMVAARLMGDSDLSGGQPHVNVWA